MFEHVFEDAPEEGTVRRYADPVEVRQGPLDPQGDQGLAEPGGAEGPQQFLWRGRLWKVRAVLAHWVETAPWWQSVSARSVVGAEPGAGGESDGARVRPSLGELLTEREVWRVEAGRGRPGPVPRTDEGDPEPAVSGVFDLAFDWAEGRWTLVGCTD